MTVVGSSSEFPIARRSMPDDIARPQPVRFPGRWVGGAVGVIATLLVGGVLLVIGLVNPDLELGFWLGLSALGVPIAFVLGRHIGPTARDRGWRSALKAMITFGFVAPVLGDVEIVGGALLVPWLTNQRGPESVAGAVVIGLFGLIFCFVALPITMAVGFVWVVLMRTLPLGESRRFRMPVWLERLGVRHALLVLGIALIVVQVIWAIARPVVPEW